jgi:hypothetical protein
VQANITEAIRETRLLRQYNFIAGISSLLHAGSNSGTFFAELDKQIEGLRDSKRPFWLNAFHGALANIDLRFYF